MKNEFTAVVRPAPEGGYWATCLEVPGANGQGETVEETIENLKEAIKLILEDRKEEMMSNLSEDTIMAKVVVG